MLDSATNTCAYTAELTPPQVSSGGGVGPFVFKVKPGKEIESLTNLVSGALTITLKVEPGKEIESLSNLASSALTIGYPASNRCNLILVGSDTNAAPHPLREYFELFPFPQMDVIQELRMLYAEEKDDLESRLRPYAMRLVYNTVVEARELMFGFHEPRQTYAADGQGGIRVEWKVGHREVRLVVPANEIGRAYIYSRNELISHMDFSISPSLLAQTLREMFSEHRSTD